MLDPMENCTAICSHQKAERVLAERVLYDEDLMMHVFEAFGSAKERCAERGLSLSLLLRRPHTHVLATCSCKG